MVSHVLGLHFLVPTKLYVWAVMKALVHTIVWMREVGHVQHPAFVDNVLLPIALATAVHKSAWVNNSLCWGHPWQAVYVIHGASGSTEYDIVTHTKVEWAQATPEYWANESKKHGKGPSAIVIDDTNYVDLNKLEKSNCYKMVQSACTHHNFTCFLVSHSLTQLIPRFRRACDIMVLWPPTTGGNDQVPYLARTLGLPPSPPLLHIPPVTTPQFSTWLDLQYPSRCSRLWEII